MGQSTPYSSIGAADIARALAEIPLYGWPADEEELVALFGRMLDPLIPDTSPLGRFAQFP